MKRVLVLVLLLSLCPSAFAQESPKIPMTTTSGSQNQRFVLFEAQYSPTVLLDTQTGLTWSAGNCIKEAGSSMRKDNNCWILMTYPQGLPLDLGAFALNQKPETIKPPAPNPSIKEQK